ncbi:MAG: DUF3991 and toprim domain-containing protein [Firmicutes bacterium]|nr:DUF3991 and toprim domain-containing protein [Bacillota bacterium]
MGYVTKDQIERARQIKVLDYILKYESNNVKRVGNGYRLKDYESVAVSEKGFYWHSHGKGGKTALDYLTDIRGYGLVDAVCTLLGERPYERGEIPDDNTQTKPVTPKARPPTQSTTAKEKPPPEKSPFAPPLRNKDNKRVIAYLQSRGIDRDLIINCIERGCLYESVNFHNAVFTGKDENGKTRFAALRGTTSSFKCDADGSDKRYGFILPPENPSSREIAIFEAPIDCLSHHTLCKQGFIPPFDGWRLSLGGTSILALEHFIKLHPEITHLIVCTDNDEAGETVAAKISEFKGKSSERSPPVNANDWNDMLQALQKAERTQNRARSGNGLNL